MSGMHKNITILGYFGKANLGDELFKVAFEAIECANPDAVKLTLAEPTQAGLTLSEDTDALICGGGDIATNYFLDVVLRLKDEYEHKTGKRLPTVAVSIGISFPENINDTRSTALDIFDHILFRNKCDHALLQERYGTARVGYLPDLVFAIPRLFGFPASVPKDVGGNTLLVCLAQSMCADGKNPAYDLLVKKLTYVLEEASKDWEIVFMNFNTNRRDSKQCDHFLTDAIQQRLTRRASVVEESDPTAVWKIFQSVDRVFAMRFHAHVLAISTETPLVSLSMTNKTEYIMQDTNILSCMVKMKIPDRKVHYPVDFDSDKVLSLLLDPDLPVPQAPEEIDSLDYFKTAIDGVINNNAPEYLNPQRVKEDILRVAHVLSLCVCKNVGIDFDAETHPKELLRLRTLSRFFFTLTGQAPSRKDDKLRNTLCALVELTLTGSDVTEFKYGLSEQIWTLDIGDGTEWILNKLAMTDGLPKSKSDPILVAPTTTSPSTTATVGTEVVEERPINPDGLTVDFQHIPQQLSKGYHRSGWKYVMDGLRTHFSGESEIIFDGYLDKTFHWSKDVSLETGLIPYQKPWIGVLHHTPNQKYTPYNTTDLVADPIFQEGLPLCKCIIVMSEFMKEWLIEQGITAPIHCLTHPTIFVDKAFDLTSCFADDTWQVVQIGGWLRDSYGIFALDTDPKRVRKLALKGKGMDNYFPSGDQAIGILDSSGVVIHEEQTGCIAMEESQKGCIEESDNTQVTNKYYAGLLKYVQDRERSVQIIEKLDDHEYDDLLSRSVVFLKLEEASACNTVIECIVRNTPILVNRIPAIVEVLGEKYPLFYDNLAEAGDFVSNASKVIEAHTYLKKLDKSRFKLETFLRDFSDILTSSSA